MSFSFASDIVELVILTTDDGFLQTLRQAVGGARRLWHVPSPDKVSDLLVAGQVGIVVLDAQTLQEAAGVFISQIKRQFPDLVVVVAGRRQDEMSLAGLITVGTVYRFIHKPMSPARARLFADAAVRKYEEQRRRFVPLPRPVNVTRRRPRLIGLAAVGALGLGCVLLWALQHRSASPATRAVDPVATMGAGPVSDAAARKGIDETRERLLSVAENAVLEERLDAAAIAIDAARKAGVDGGRLALLNSQLARSRQQSKTVGMSRSRSEASSGGARGADEHLADLLALAAERIQQGRLIEPDGDSARFYVQEALHARPDNEAAQTAEESLALALLADARQAIARRDFAHAVSVLDAAGGIASRANVDNLLELLRAARRQAELERNGPAQSK